MGGRTGQPAGCGAARLPARYRDDSHAPTQGERTAAPRCPAKERAALPPRQTKPTLALGQDFSGFRSSAHTEPNGKRSCLLFPSALRLFAHLPRLRIVNGGLGKLLWSQPAVLELLGGGSFPSQSPCWGETRLSRHAEVLSSLPKQVSTLTRAGGVPPPLSGCYSSRAPSQNRADGPRRRTEKPCCSSTAACSSCGSLKLWG